jgi:hypothetical protein
MGRLLPSSETVSAFLPDKRNLAKIQSTYTIFQELVKVRN